MKNVFAVVMLFVSILNLQAKKYDISLHLEEGRTYVQNMVTEMTIVQEFNGQEIKISMAIDGGMEYLVKEVTETSYELDVKYTSLGIKMDMPLAKMEFQSGQVINDSITDMMALLFNKLVGKTFQLNLDKKGKVNSVTGINEILTGLLDGLPEVSEEKRMEFSEQINSSFGEEAVTKSLEMQTAIFPDQSVNIGETWSKETTFKSTMVFEMNTTYVLESIENEVYIITSTSNLIAPKMDKFEMKNGVFSKTELSGTATRKIEVIIKSGWVRASNENQNISGNIFMKMTKEADVITVPMKIEGTTTISN